MSEKKAYCGIGPIPKNQKRGSMLECAEKKQVKYWGLHTVDKRTLQKALLNTTTKAHLNRLKTSVINLKYDILAMKKKYKKLTNKSEKEALKKTMEQKNEVFLKKRQELMDLETARGQTIVYKKKKPEESTKKATPKPTPKPTTKAAPKPTTKATKKATPKPTPKPTTAKKGAPNRWMEHVKAVKELNVDMPYKLVLQEAKKTYKPLKETVPKPPKKAPKSTKKSSPTLKWLYDAKLDRGPVLSWLNDPVDDDAAFKSLYVPRARGPGAARGLPKLKKTDILESIPWLADPGKDPKKTARKAAPAAPKKPAAKSTKKAAPAAPKGPKKIDPAFKRGLAGWITAGKNPYTS